MDTNPLKPANSRGWRWARIGAYLCFALASLLMIASLWAPVFEAEPGASLPPAIVTGSASN